MYAVIMQVTTTDYTRNTKIQGVNGGKQTHSGQLLKVKRAGVKTEF
jgi:hypothetical protein